MQEPNRRNYVSGTTEEEIKYTDDFYENDSELVGLSVGWSRDLSNTI